MKGFTLIEILVSVFILSLLIAGIYGVLNIAEISWHSDMGLLDLQQQVRQAMDGMDKEIRQSRPSNIIISNAGSVIQFTIPINITTNPITYSSAITYYLSNNQIVREHPSATTKILANNITTFNFCCIGGASCTDCSNASMLQMQINATKTALNRPLSFSLTEKVMFRNE